MLELFESSLLEKRVALSRFSQCLHIFDIVHGRNRRMGKQKCPVCKCCLLRSLEVVRRIILSAF